MVGEGEGFLGHFPGFGPAHAVDIHQQAHEFGDADGGVGVVELGGELFVEGVELAAAGQVGANHVLQGAGDEEELLFQPQLLALNLLVVGVEDFGDVLGDDFAVHRAVVVPHVEGLEVEGFFSTASAFHRRRVLMVLTL